MVLITEKAIHFNHIFICDLLISLIHLIRDSSKFYHQENIKAYLSYAKKPTGQRVSRPSFEDDGCGRMQRCICIKRCSK
ncbi:hypothetical protein GIB67_008963 [Kingdonia uniflora]|uniref:Uncharacterized protein n=1 Tax=Kingdonia uniflora TaxID=39325 RepID=A0A7J7LVR2_9MAGN|nr:hypothetical protein GIB67_008963 [Kingdonia uniflora]